MSQHPFYMTPERRFCTPRPALLPASGLHHEAAGAGSMTPTARRASNVTVPASLVLSDGPLPGANGPTSCNRRAARKPPGRYLRRQMSGVNRGIDPYAISPEISRRLEAAET